MFASANGYLVIPPRLATLATIVALHVLVAYVLITSFARPAPDSAPNPIIASFLHDPVPPLAPPLPLTPHLLVQRPDYSPPPIVIDTAAPAPDSMVLPTVPPSDANSTVAPPQDPMRLVGRNVLPSSADYYPADLRRAGVEGATTVQVCVDENGRMQGQPAVEASSGNTRLDQGAINIARDGHYARAMRGAAPVPNCYRFRIIFEMQPAH